MGRYPALPPIPLGEPGTPFRAAPPSMRGAVTPGTEPWNRSDQKGQLQGRKPHRTERRTHDRILRPAEVAACPLSRRALPLVHVHDGRPRSEPRRRRRLPGVRGLPGGSSTSGSQDPRSSGSLSDLQRVFSAISSTKKKMVIGSPCSRSRQVFGAACGTSTSS